ncbi:hypothetical protein QWY97_20385 [Vibrio cortegadensis]|uniref:hypothetical protein n=1 Tax=Vibrio cortegadensis TaxID=1328770 RepID=UPI0021C299F5|nr:hypothetical protein [Vibrio cortegadensis]MDN3699666.1 hypothetical protein [Vibrio cortegadensis]
MKSIDYKDLASKTMAGVYVCDVPSQTWLSMMEYIIDNIESFSFDTEKMHRFWISNGGHIRRHVRNDQLVLTWLRFILPKYSGDELRLYRGECKFLYNQGLIGFCWTPKKEVAEKFASGLNAIESGGVLLSAKCAPEAILSAPNSHSADWLGEFEYTCDPTQISDIEVLHQYPKL